MKNTDTQPMFRASYFNPSDFSKPSYVSSMEILEGVVDGEIFDFYAEYEYAE